MGQLSCCGITVNYEGAYPSGASRTVTVTSVSINTSKFKSTVPSVTGSGTIKLVVGSKTIATATVSGSGVLSYEILLSGASDFQDKVAQAKSSGTNVVTYSRGHTDSSSTARLEVYGAADSNTFPIAARLSYKVSYNANGGSGAPSAQTKWYGETLTLSSSKPTRTGYTFKGWGTSSSATSASYQPGGSYTANSGTPLYAIWQINTYTVSYANGGRGTAPSSQTKTYGTDLPLRAGLGVVSNYRFSKWKALDGTLYDGGGTYSKNATTTMTAQWIAPYTISYNGNGSTGGSTSAQTKVHDTAITLQSNGFTRTNYTFAGWNTKANGSGTTYSAGQSYTANAALTLYAQWTQVYASPTLTISKVYRADSGGTASDDGTYLALEASYSVYSGGGNAIDSWRAECNEVPSTTPVSGGTDLSGTVKFVIAANLSTESSYSVTLTLTDTNGGADGLSSGTVTKATTLGVAAYPLDVWRFDDDGSYGVAIGGLVTRKGLDVFSDAYFRGDVTLSNALPIASGGTGATTAAGARTALGLGSFATRSSLGLGVTAKDGSVKDSSARSSGANYEIDITLAAESGYMPLVVLAVTTNSGQAFLRGFDLDGLSTGSAPKVKTYWHANAAMSANTVTYTAQVMLIKTTLP